MECTFHDICPVPMYGSASNLVLPALRRMRFGGIEIYPGMFRFSDDSVQKVLTLPAVENLRLPLRNLSFKDLFMFLQRSSPPLKELSIAYTQPTSVTLSKCLHLVPTLQRFEVLTTARSSFLNELLTELTNSPSLVPDLHSLRIDMSGNVEPGSCWESLLRVLSSRSQIRLVHIGLDRRYPDSKPAARFLNAFEEMAMGGLQIYIGIDGVDANLVSV
ncbi:hypothetical protein C8R47DRAFT_301244 [Mycena vitilis]|nr:hypothetical protein C8R47DRAFT_301244 [Mycena vitilis]